MRRILTILVTVTTIMTLTAGAASAGRGDRVPSERIPAEKISVCHLDADTNESHLININAMAVAQHMEHGDDVPGLDKSVLDTECQPIAPTPSIAMLVDGAYSNDGLDTSFTAFENGDGVVSGVGSYYYTANGVQLTVEVERVCLNPGDRHATVWGPGTFTKNGTGLTTGFVLVTIVDNGSTTSTWARFKTGRDAALGTYDNQCDDPFTFLGTDPGGSLIFS